jgi:hypothetical protein
LQPQLCVSAQHVSTCTPGPARKFPPTRFQSLAISSPQRVQNTHVFPLPFLPLHTWLSPDSGGGGSIRSRAPMGWRHSGQLGLSRTMTVSMHLACEVRGTRKEKARRDTQCVCVVGSVSQIHLLCLPYLDSITLPTPTPGKGWPVDCTYRTGPCLLVSTGVPTHLLQKRCPQVVMQAPSRGLRQTAQSSAPSSPAADSRFR